MHADSQALSAIASSSPAAPVSTVADVILQLLSRLGARYVYGVPGGAIEPFYDALARSERAGSIRSILARSEQGATFMAHGYALESGTVGVCCATSGPGATNLVTGAASAMSEQVPTLYVTGQPALKKHGANPLQDSSDVGVDVVRLLGAVTKFSSMVTSPEQLVNKLVSALSAALTVPQGPVHLSIPSDVMRAPLAPISPERLANIVATLDRPRRLSQEIDLASVAALMARLSLAKAPVMIMGERSAMGRPEILEFLRATGMPAVVTPSGVGAIPWEHPSFAGVYGYAGHAGAGEVLKAADLVLAVGLGMRELDTNGMEGEVFDSRLLCIDNQLTTRAHMASLHVIGDLNKIFQVLCREAKHLPDGGQRRRFQVPPVDRGHVATAGRLHPAELMQALPGVLPAGTVLYADAGSSWAWSLHHGRIGENLSKVRTAMGFGAMGFSIGAVIGAKMALPERPIAAMVGDGAWMMSALELSMAVEQRVNAVFLILSDQSLGMVMHGQRLGNAERIAHDLPQTDFCMIARAVGARCHRVSSVAELQALDWTEVFRGEGPCVIELMIDREALPPMQARISSLASATPGQ